MAFVPGAIYRTSRWAIGAPRGTSSCCLCKGVGNCECIVVATFCHGFWYDLHNGHLNLRFIRQLNITNALSQIERLRTLSWSTFNNQSIILHVSLQHYHKFILPHTDELLLLIKNFDVTNSISQIKSHLPLGMVRLYSLLVGTLLVGILLVGRHYQKREPELTLQLTLVLRA